MLTRPAGIFCVCGFFYGLSVSALGQAGAQSLSANKPNRITLAYFGENATNPGASLGYEAAFYYRRPHELMGGAHIGGYNSADPSYYGVFFYLEGGYRLNLHFGLFFEARIGLGYVNVTRSSQIETLPDGTMTGTIATTGNYLMPIALAGLGWDFLPLTNVPISLFADVGGMGRYTQAEAFSGGLALTAGLAYQFGTRGPRRAELPVAPPPPAQAPVGIESTGPAEPLPPPAAPGSSVPPPVPMPVSPQSPPELPPPPSVPASP